MREELQLLQEPGSYVGEVVKIMGKTKVLVKTQPEGKYIVDFANDIKLEDLRPNLRVALRSDSYQLHRILPTKTDPLVSLMMVEKVPDSTYEMVGGLDKQIKEVKEVIELREDILHLLSMSSTDPRDTQPSNIQNSSTRSASSNPRECYCTVHRAPARRY